MNKSSEVSEAVPMNFKDRTDRERLENFPWWFVALILICIAAYIDHRHQCQLSRGF